MRHPFGGGREGATPQGEPTNGAGGPTGTMTIKEVYEGGTSKRWKSFLEYFAHRPEQWVKMAEGFEAVGFKVEQGVGLVGAAERRCKGNLPYQKRWGTRREGGGVGSPDVQDEILRLAAHKPTP